MNFNKKIFTIILLIICMLSLSSLSAYTGTGFTHNVPNDYYNSYTAQDILNKYNNTYYTSEEKAVCTKVVDGDTIYLNNGRKVRLVGVNTPERNVQGYHASKRFVEKLCLNQEIGINIDDRKYRDKYGRTLAVVIVGGKNLNEMLLKEGLAEVMYIPPSEFSPYKWAGSTTLENHVNSNTSHATDVQNVSSKDKVVSSSSSSQYVGNLRSHKFHSITCDQVNKMSEKNKIYFNSREEAINNGFVGCQRCNP